MAKIALTEDLIRDIIDFSKENHDNGFLVHLGGRLDRNSGMIVAERLIYQGYMEPLSPASIITGHMPVVDDTIGTVHNSSSEKHAPNKRDKEVMEKGYGSIHVISFYPYKENNIRIYDNAGSELDWTADGG